MVEFAGGSMPFQVWISLGRDFSSPAMACAAGQTYGDVSIVHPASASACGLALSLADVTARLQRGSVTPEGPLYLIVSGTLAQPVADPAQRYGLFEIDWDLRGATPDPGPCGEVLTPQCFGLLYASPFAGIEQPYLSWQDPAQSIDCAGAVPTRGRSWGAAKTIYR